MQPGLVNAIIDLSHHNAVASFREAASAGLLGIIHKASEGTEFKDPAYDEIRARASELGLLWGAYHFGTGDDPFEQAEFFLDCNAPGGRTVLALDFERNPNGRTMSVAKAEAFIAYLRGQTGKWPLFYSSDLVKDLLGGSTSEILARCPLWLAEYRRAPRAQASWRTWTLWQYTDGAVGPEPREVAGVGRCDRDLFNGDAAALKAFWARTGV